MRWYSPVGLWVQSRGFRGFRCVGWHRLDAAKHAGNPARFGRNLGGILSRRACAYRMVEVPGFEPEYPEKEYACISMQSAEKQPLVRSFSNREKTCACRKVQLREVFVSGIVRKTGPRSGQTARPDLPQIGIIKRGLLESLAHLAGNPARPQLLLAYDRQIRPKMIWTKFPESESLGPRR